MIYPLEGRISTSIIQDSSVQEICLFSPIYLFISLITSLYQYGIMDIYFILWVFMYFIAQIVSVWAIENSVSWLLCLFDILYILILFLCK